MHGNAPVVSCIARRARFEGIVAAALWSGAAWLALQGCRVAAAQDTLGWRHALIVACLLATGLAALHGWRRTPQGRLRWDGRCWFWSDATGRETPGELVLQLDLQRCVLVRWRGLPSATHWIWLDASDADARWHEVRCALHARPQPEPAALAGPVAER